MAERPFYFVVVSILFFNVEIFSQQNRPECIKLPINYNTLANFEFEKQLKPDWPPKDSLAKLIKPYGDSAISKSLPSLFVLSPCYYSSNLSFFCSKELKLEKITSVPFRFRLGSLEYVNYLEQKPNTRKPF